MSWIGSSWNSISAIDRSHFVSLCLFQLAVGVMRAPTFITMEQANYVVALWHQRGSISWTHVGWFFPKKLCYGWKLIRGSKSRLANEKSSSHYLKSEFELCGLHWKYVTLCIECIGLSLLQQESPLHSNWPFIDPHNIKMTFRSAAQIL